MIWDMVPPGLGSGKKGGEPLLERLGCQGLRRKCGIFQCVTKSFQAWRNLGVHALACVFQCSPATAHARQLEGDHQAPENRFQGRSHCEPPRIGPKNSRGQGRARCPQRAVDGWVGTCNAGCEAAEARLSTSPTLWKD